MFTDLRIPAGRRPMTASEARITFVLSAMFLLLIGAAIFEDFTVQKLSIVFILLFWVPLLVLHELGHALMAKALGWRVREIVIGFGRTLFESRIGETQLKIKMAPVEGYVLPAPVTPQRIRLKSMLVYAAGPGAELLLLGLLVLVYGAETVFNDADEIGLVALHSLAIAILIGAGFNLLPFRSEGAVSDGLGIISSPFMSDESIELRLLTFDLRTAQAHGERGESSAMLDIVEKLLARFPHNDSLQQFYAASLSLDGQHETARQMIREKLAAAELPVPRRRAWLHLQAIAELGAEDPSWLVLDLALQKAFAITKDAPDLLATRGASLVMRGQYEEGGNLLAKAWRANDGSASDAEMLAYLAIAAHRSHHEAAAEHFHTAFLQVNQSARLLHRVKQMTSMKD